MRKLNRLLLFLAVAAVCAATVVSQGVTGSIDISARITPTGARPEPVRQFTFYVLTRSYADVVKDVEAEDVLPSREKFISDLKDSPELKAWLKSHDVMDLTSPDLDQSLTPDDVMKVPEFFAAYMRANSGGVTPGFPKAKFSEMNRDAHPDKYKKEHEDYLAEIRKFIIAHPATIQGIELELAGVNPKAQWDRLEGDHKRRTARLAPDTAQVKYLAVKMETDLEGRAIVGGLPPGNYWVSTLGMDAASGDRHLLWDVPVKVAPGQTTHLDLTNLNGMDLRSAAHQ